MDGVNNAFCSSKEEYEIARLTTKCAGLQGKIESQAAEIADLKEQIKQLRTEADFNFEQYQDAGRLMCDLQEIAEQQAEAIRLKDAALEKIACIGNGDTHGNSIGNCLAIDALAIQPSPQILKHEIAELDSLRNDAVLRLDTYKALCDQMGNALEYYQPGIEGGLICIPNGCMTEALEAWRAIK